MRRLKGPASAILAVALVGFLTFGKEALASLKGGPPYKDCMKTAVALSKSMSFGNRLRLARSPEADDDRPRASIDLEINFDYDSATINAIAELQLRDLGAALSSPDLKGMIFSINGHTDAFEVYGFNNRLSERRAMAIKAYLVDNFQLSPDNVRTVGYGKTRLKNKAYPYAAENRRVEIVRLDCP
jgi:outer membrane protein OmpA-like peptidoglycan-associated protein